ncbi:hypothetical protein [Winogradskya humida]|uniref:IPT/TIG domain-containing protein n=1 Tax=Winogradskya humida TaxID=113566 RepID=A0ABQ3ZU86_9ACTN|nr:hypothetical protein [Actinoplanes humidus]GIE22161.1 hypothetical protein Ahu01nite_052630 [Actinoplanes humidus]
MGLGAPAFAAAGSPTELTTAGQACVTTAPGPYLSPSRLNDAQAVLLRGEYDASVWSDDSTADFQVWDVTTPDEPQDWSDRGGATDGHLLVQLEDPSRQLDGVTYGWKVRLVDGEASSPWSDTCYYTVDRSGGAAPAVTSAEYPPGDWDNSNGEIGTAGSFTFTPADDDAVSYQYDFYADNTSEPKQTIAAPRLGGPVTISWAPRAAGYNSLTVYAIDRAGNYSERQDYTFYVRETRPSVFSAAYQESAGYGDLKYNVGVPGEFDFDSNVPDTTSFVWHIDQDGPSGTADADSEGNAAVMIAPVKASYQTLYVRSVARDGAPHPERAYRFYVDNAPQVTGDINKSVIIGSSLKFHLAPRTDDVTAYVYWNEDSSSHESAKVTIPADGAGAADLTWLADNTTENTNGVRVQARSADGTLSEARWLPISVWGAAPTVNRTGGTVVGSTATITVRTEMTNVKEYEAVLNRDDATKQIVPAAADGTATFKFTPTKAQYTYVTVIARNAAGVHTDEGSTSWSVTDGPAVTSADFPASGSGHMTAGTFTFKAQQAGATAFVYSIDGTDRFQVEVPVGADGTATTAPWTPETSGSYSLHVTSKTSNGTRSSETYYSFTVAADPVTVTSVSPGTVTPGGVRTLTVTGSGFQKANYTAVHTSDGSYVSGTITGISADRKTLTAEYDLTGAALGAASLDVQADGYNSPVTLANAFTVANQSTPLKVVTAPVITGTAAVGSTLKSSTGTYTPAASAYTYQWAAGGTAISGATASSYVVKPADLGKMLSVSVTATKTGYLPVTEKSAATAVIAKGPAAVNTALPKITGTAKVGSTLNSSTGTWKPTPTSYRYEWRTGGTLLATTASLKLTTAMQGKKIAVTAIAVRAGYEDGKATSTTVTVTK